MIILTTKNSFSRIVDKFLQAAIKNHVCHVIDSIKGDISTLNNGSLKSVDKFTYFGSSISSNENGINIHQAKVWTAINRLLIIWIYIYIYIYILMGINRLSILRKSDLADKIKHNFSSKQLSCQFSLYGCTTWTLTKCIWKKLDRNCRRML